MKQIELIEKRKAREKHFLKEDGVIVANVYDEDIHFLKNGKYEEIDNSLIEDNGYYTNKSNAYKVFFGTKKKDKLMKFEVSNHYININIDNKNLFLLKKGEVKSKLLDHIDYCNILDNIDIKYKILTSKVKEEIILKNSNINLNNITFRIDTDLNLILKEDKSIVATKDGNSFFSIDAPYMIDAEGSINKDVFYELEKVNDEYLLRLVWDEKWLKSKSTKYPIIIDPTITNLGQNNSVYDTYIFPNDTNIDRNSQDILKVGVERVNDVDIVNRALIKFELPTISTGDQIISAIMYLNGYPTSVENYQFEIINVHRVANDWNELTANWDTMNDKYDTRIESAFKSARGNIFPNNAIGTSVNYANITNLVRKWYSSLPNYGIMLKLNEEVYTNNVLPEFYSKNNLVSGTNPKPILEITYRNQNGLEKYMDYQSQSLTNGKIYENSYNGNLIMSFNIGSTREGKLPTNLNLFYNTNDVVLNNDLGYGLGYRLSLGQTIKQMVIDEQNYLQYVDEDGTIHYFYQYEGKYYDEDGLNLTAQDNSDNFIIYDNNGNTMKFIKSGEIGYLSEIKDVSNNLISIIYNPNKTISKIVDANETEICLSYESNKITITSPDRTIYLNYLNNKIINMTTNSGVTTFIYNAQNIISNVTDENGMKLAYEYYCQSPYRIKKVSEYGINNTLGNYYNISYGLDSTTITDSKNKVKTMIFNSYGCIKSISNLKSQEGINDGYGSKRNYGEVPEYISNQMAHQMNRGYKNKLISYTELNKYVKNYLTNTSFEGSDVEFSTTSDVALSISADTCLTGLKSLKAVNTTNNKVLNKSIVVEKGKYYTFSAYLKNTGKIRISLSYTNNGNVEKISEIINPSTEFARYDITINYPLDATSELFIKIYLDDVGTTYIDDIQLEEGEVANAYNMLENSDFSKGLSDWDILSPTNNIFEVVTLEDGNKSLKINMNPQNSTELSKTFYMDGQAGDVYTISFWFKNEGFVGEQGMGSTIANDTMIFFYYKDAATTGHCIYPSEPFNSSENEWQYFEASFGAEKDYEKIELRFNQRFNGNKFYLTNLFLRKSTIAQYYDYDDSGNVITQSKTGRGTENFSYDKNNQLIKMTNPKGKNFKYEYDNLITDRVINGISEGGISNEVKYDSFGNPVLTRITKKNEPNITNSLYKIRMKGTKKYLRNINNVLILNSDNCNHDLWNVESSGDYYKINHSILNNYYLTVVENNLILSGFNGDASLFSLIKKDNGSYLIKSKTSDKYVKVSENCLEMVTLIEDDCNFQFYFEVIDNKLFIENSATYTNDGKFLTSTTDTNLHKTVYDTDNITGLLKSVTNARGQTTNYTYNNKKQLISVNNGDKSVNYEYNVQNLLSKIVQDEREYNFEYDEFLNIKSVKIGNNITLITNNYGANNGNLESSTYGNNQTISYEYDEFDRIKKVIKVNDVYDYKYGNNGDLLKIISNDDLVKYTYDLGQRLTEYRFNNFKIKYGYDVNRNVISKSYILDNAVCNINNTLNDDDGIITTMLDSNEVNYTYDCLGRITNRNINTNYNTDYNYVNNGNRTSLLVKSIKNNNDSYSYKYDNLNNITHIYHNEELENKYYYDDYNELIKENNYLLNQTIRYKYDNSGNILYKKVCKLDTYDEISQNKYEYNNSNWKDQLTKFNDKAITYDNIGNPLTIGENIILSWINGRQLNSYVDTTNNISYKYNKDGIRVSKTLNNEETKYYLEGNKIIFEKTGNNVLYYLRSKEELIGLKYNDNLYYYIKNVQNDIIGIVDSSNNVVARYTYDSWGNILTVVNGNSKDVSNNSNHIANINPFRYRSYYYDRETKLYYLNSRYYNPLWGRFISIDGGIGENGDIISCNLYNYCSNNPITNIDENGNFAISLAGLSVKLLTGIVLGAVALLNLPEIQNAVIKIATDIKTKVSSLSNVSTDIKNSKANEEKHYVYTLTDYSQKPEKVEYVGRTINLEMRRNQHINNPYRSHLMFEAYTKTPVDYYTARGLEQKLIVQYQTLNKGNPTNNQINGIRWDNPRYGDYINAANKWLMGDSETYVGG